MERLPLLLEFEPDADPITGIMRFGEAPATPFCGWVEVIAAVEAACAAARQDSVPSRAAELR